MIDSSKVLDSFLKGTLHSRSRRRAAPASTEQHHTTAPRPTWALVVPRNRARAYLSSIRPLSREVTVGQALGRDERPQVEEAAEPVDGHLQPRARVANRVPLLRVGRLRAADAPIGEH